jgi:predicted ester cyclase
MKNTGKESAPRSGNQSSRRARRVIRTMKMRLARRGRTAQDSADKQCPAPQNACGPPGAPKTMTTTIQERLGWKIAPELYEKIRRLWIKHSIAEDSRDLPGLMDTLAEDCVYEIPALGLRWEGHEGARRFYTTFLGAFPDVKFNLTDIVIGPQGVFEVAQMTATHQGPWAGFAASGKPVCTTVIIFFPWNPTAAKFAGEKIYIDRAAFGNRTQEFGEPRMDTDGPG